jgi:hypothetical protein
MLCEGNDSDRLTVEMIVSETAFLETMRKANKTKHVK